MNFSAPEHAARDLPLRLMGAIKDPDKWSEVLETIMAETGVKAAIITLRDKTNCQIVNDTDLEQKFHSPLIRGFSTEAIVHYLTNLRTIDPWAEFQRQHYPYRPVQMSKVCPQHTVPDRRFFEWLAGEGFTDTVVFELDRMAGYWTAINLFLETPTGAVADRALAFANANYELLRNAWATSQDMTRSRQASSALMHRASHAGVPICLVGANGEMVESNDLFNTYIETDAIRTSGRDKKLSFAHGVSVFGIDRWAQHEFLTHDTEIEPVVLFANPVEPDPLFAEKREKLWMLTCSNAGADLKQATQAAGLDLHLLTEQERNLLSEISAGKSITEAGSAINLKRSRTFEVWSSVKEKLGIVNAHQLRL